MRTISISSKRRIEMLDITPEVSAIVSESGVSSGICVVYVPHTTAGVTINENADPSVKADLLEVLTRLIPHVGDYRHTEGNSDAHIKASLVGFSQIIPIANGRLALGTWQGILFCEFDGPRHRKVHVQIIAK